MRFSISLIMAMVSVALVSESVRADHVRSLDELKQQMTQLGKPALVIAGADWCVHCREIAQELATVPELQPLKKQFAILKIDADTPLWAAARRAFKFEEKGVPAVFVFRADGKELHSGAGKPTDMEGFLKRNLQQAGLILTPVQAQILNKDLAKLERALKLKNLSEAIKISEPYDLGKSFAQTAITMTAIQKQIREQVTENLSNLEQKLKETPDDLSAYYELMTLKENCTHSRTLIAQVQEAEKSVKASGLSDETITQAELLMQADSLRKNRKRREERAIYEDILKKYPQSTLAQIAQERLGNKRSSQSESSSISTDSSDDKSRKKSEMYLRLAKKLLKIKSPKAKQYLKKAIEAAPQSESAKQAQQLMK